MSETRTTKTIFIGKLEGRRRRGRPRKRWIDDVEEDLRKMGVRCWRRKAEDRDEWRRVIEEVKVLHGLVPTSQSVIKLHLEYGRRFAYLLDYNSSNSVDNKTTLQNHYILYNDDSGNNKLRN
ncbi:hypothetical protein C0J52_24400 [Blattella germanica]|nr:hypothetical protein C0J52_24400 [Blattella germanica]